MSGPRRAATAVLVAVIAAAGVARADGWYFTWHCQGRCADGRASVDGTEGPFGSEADCDRAQRAKRFDLNASGDSAGTAGECYSDGSGAGSGPTGTIVRAAVLARAYLGAVYGTPWVVEYANGTRADVGPTTG